MNRRRSEAIELAIGLQRQLEADGVLIAPIRCAEIGARKPPAGELLREPFYRLPNRMVAAFEADSVEARRLAERFDPAQGVEIVDAAIGAKNGRGRLHVTANPKCSSLYTPNDAFLDRYPALDVVRLDRIVDVELKTLDFVAAERDWPSIDFVKMDVQGAELDIVCGAPLTFDKALCVVGEVSFVQVYKDQPLFGDLAAQLVRHGLEFYRFVHIGGRARTQTRSDQMQMMWGDALFLRAPESLAREAAGKLAVLATLYGAFDVAEIALGRLENKDALSWFMAQIAEPTPALWRKAIRRVRRLGGRVSRSIGMH